MTSEEKFRSALLTVEVNGAFIAHPCALHSCRPQIRAPGEKPEKIRRHVLKWAGVRQFRRSPVPET